MDSRPAKSMRIWQKSMSILPYFGLARKEGRRDVWVLVDFCSVLRRCVVLSLLSVKRCGESSDFRTRTPYSCPIPQKVPSTTAHSSIPFFSISNYHALHASSNSHQAAFPLNPSPWHPGETKKKMAVCKTRAHLAASYFGIWSIRLWTFCIFFFFYSFPTVKLTG